MNATFQYAVVYQVRVLCYAPFRTANADGETETVLYDSEGRPFLQGSSLAGAMREWLFRRDPALVEDLFGSQKKNGKLIVSDMTFDAGSQMDVRPRLKLDRRLGTVEGKKKFDIAHICRGETGSFTLSLLSTKEECKKLAADTERLLAALNVGDICLGAQKSNGFGRMTLTGITRCEYDMTQSTDRRAWFDGQPANSRTIPLPSDVERDYVVFHVTGHADSLLVKASARIPKQGGGSYTPNLSEKQSDGKYGCLLPGSSLKGTVRTRAEAIAEYLGLTAETVYSLFGREPKKQEDNGLAGRIRFSDAVLENPKERIVSRIRINRFTGGTLFNSLFSEAPVSCDVSFDISVPDEPVSCLLILYALRDLGLGLYTLGSGWAIGRGYLNEMNLYITAPDRRKADLCFDRDFKLKLISDDDGLIASWKWRDVHENR